ncbi:hypothetical protein [Salarchaeum sp. JOR-1]|uniref:hypothetical protein n=1 Tax=Salarchaeum sp. JOR-1 TaxID=2599399 RepID=UPI00119839C2|nr:hypothetical protein [Salarchaeum sp. JOR-1]QDX40521.1 hypothetical protein FQU85_06265 [Salarchaeum sp. JOR-1]
MLRSLLTTICTVEVAAPAALIDTAERLALDNPDDVEVRSWVVPGARLEGLTFLWLMWRSDESYSQFKQFLGLIGLLALLYPRAYVDYGARLAYVDSRQCDWRSWVYPGTRLVGFVYLLVGLRELRRA